MELSTTLWHKVSVLYFSFVATYFKVALWMKLSVLCAQDRRLMCRPRGNTGHRGKCRMSSSIEMEGQETKHEREMDESSRRWLAWFTSSGEGRSLVILFANGEEDGNNGGNILNQTRELVRVWRGPLPEKTLLLSVGNSFLYRFRNRYC